MRPITKNLSHDMTLLHLKEQHYRTDRLTGLFAVPLAADTATEYAILPGLLTRGCAAYPTLASFSRRLDALYGATVNGQIYRLGGWQVLAFSISYLNRRYTMDGSDLTAPCTDLLLDMLFDPMVTDGAFDAEAFAQEKRCLLERLQGEVNNKRMYARQRCEELICPDHPYSLNPNGSVAAAEALTAVSAAAARERMLSEATIHWMYQSAEESDVLEQKLKARFDTLSYRRPATLNVDTAFALKETAVTERMALQQAKLVLGFRIAITDPEGNVEAAQLMNTLLGGCATSLLFTHVREEQSLCYYCASSYDRYQGIILVDSGVQEQDAEKAKTEILKQLEAVRQGNFSDDELEAARRSMVQRYVAAADNPEALENYYLTQTVCDNYVTPEEKRSRTMAVTKEDVCRAARLTHFDTVYLLAPEEEVAH